jgi:hypothetical protein
MAAPAATTSAVAVEKVAAAGRSLDRRRRPSYHRAMAAAMTQRRRLAAAIAGQPVDRLPVSLWRHFYVQETSRAGLVEAMVRWQKTYDWDFLKINPRASYPVEDWGNRYDFSGREHVPPALGRACVHAAEDFRHLDRRLFTQPGGREALLEQARAAHCDAAGRPFVLAATCTIDTTADPEAVRAVREFVST